MVILTALRGVADRAPAKIFSTAYIRTQTLTRIAFVYADFSIASMTAS